MAQTPAAVAGLSRKALLARGALAAYLAPRLAKDQKIDLRDVLLGTTAGNWQSAKPVIVKRLKRAVQGKLAQDANVEEVEELLERLDEEEDEDGERVDQDRAVIRRGRPSRDANEVSRTETDPEEREDNPGTHGTGEDEDGDELEHVAKFIAEKLTPEDMDELESMVNDARMRRRDGRARDADPTDPQIRAERLRRGLGDRRPRARDAEPENRREKEEEEQERRQAAEDAARRNSKRAMDEMAADIRKQVAAEQAAIREAENAARPYVGQLLAQDTAEGVYRLALDTLGVKHAAIKDVAALKAVLQAQPLPGRRQQPLAADARPANSNALAKRFGDGIHRLKNVAV